MAVLTPVRAVTLLHGGLPLLLRLRWPVDACLRRAFTQDQTGLAESRQVSFQRPRPNLEPLAQLAGAQAADARQLVQNGLPAESDVAAAEVRYPAIYPAIYTATLAG
jgi:hypothetical protein